MIRSTFFHYKTKKMSLYNNNYISDIFSVSCRINSKTLLLHCLLFPWCSVFQPSNIIHQKSSLDSCRIREAAWRKNHPSHSHVVTHEILRCDWTQRTDDWETFEMSSIYIDDILKTSSARKNNRKTWQSSAW